MNEQTYEEQVGRFTVLKQLKDMTYNPKQNFSLYYSSNSFDAAMNVVREVMEEDGSHYNVKIVDNGAPFTITRSIY